jgi:hypothetical protein
MRQQDLNKETGAEGDETAKPDVTTGILSEPSLNLQKGI